jgi:hypothetical protein
MADPAARISHFPTLLIVVINEVGKWLILSACTMWGKIHGHVLDVFL